jgi:hypothetical protein
MPSYIVRRIPDELWRRFKARASLTGLTPHAIFVRWIEEYGGSGRPSEPPQVPGDLDLALAQLTGKAEPPPKAPPPSVLRRGRGRPSGITRRPDGVMGPPEPSDGPESDDRPEAASASPVAPIGSGTAVCGSHEPTIGDLLKGQS